MATIQGIYIALFGRPADPAGLEFFTEATNDGADLTAIGDLASTDEYQERFTGLTREEVVNSIYQSLFGRDGEPAGLKFFVDAWNAGTYNINNIAIAILDGALGDDLATVNAKIAAANIFTANLDQDLERDAYSGDDAAAIARDFINNVDKDDPGTEEEADAAILEIVNAQGGQAPDDGGSVGGGGGSVSFAARVVNGELQFRGASDTPIAVSIDDDGQLVFQQGTKTAVLRDSDLITSIDPNVSLQAVPSEDSSDVLALVNGKWEFIDQSVYKQNADGLDFYAAINKSGNVLLLDGFDVSSLDGGLTWGTVFNFLGGQVNSLPELVGAVDFLAHAGSANSNIAVAATSEANTSINGIIDSLFGEVVRVLDSDVGPQIGMPIMLEGAGSNVLSASGDDGYILIGNIDAIHDAASMFIENGLDWNNTVKAALNADSDDIITGSSGTDIILGLGGDDILTGNAGRDIFVSVNVQGAYTDDTDTVTDFSEDDLFVLTSTRRLEISEDEDGNAIIIQSNNGNVLAVLEGVDSDEVEFFVEGADLGFADIDVYIVGYKSDDVEQSQLL